ncbi:MAG: PspC domain-containing protein [Lachnospiraceae bacterium]|nr:PspC domain-containing protein [Lachnospiraceae bacterium]
MKKLIRSKKDRIIGGVCGGMGLYLNVDPNIVRLVWALLGLTGTGLILYIVAYFIIPEESDIIDGQGEDIE